MFWMSGWGLDRLYHSLKDSLRPHWQLCVGGMWTRWDGGSPKCNNFQLFGWSFSHFDDWLWCLVPQLLEFILQERFIHLLVYINAEKYKNIDFIGSLIALSIYLFICFVPWFNVVFVQERLLKLSFSIYFRFLFYFTCDISMSYDMFWYLSRMKSTLILVIYINKYICKYISN